jgi:hypothetical protein
VFESQASALAWLVLCVTAGSACFAVRKLLNLPRRTAAVGAVGAGAAMLGLLVLLRLSTEPGSAVVSITSPRPSTHVEGYQLQVSGTVRPAHARVTLLVRSERDPRWWVQTVVHPRTIEGTTGLWSIDARVGTATEGIQETFYIVALASSSTYWHDIVSGHDLTTGRRLLAVPAWSQSEPLTVWRAR